MKNKFQQAVAAGVLATAIMTVMMVLAGAMGMPKMSPPNMLSSMVGVPLAVGWIMHFMIGIIFAAAYVYLFNHWLHKINSRALKGVIFGLAVFIVAHIAMPLLSAMFAKSGMQEPQGSKALIFMGSMVGHIVYGISVALVVKPEGQAVSKHPMA
jgi:uncharacterized membrane protein YagU involved in acid resistance